MSDNISRKALIEKLEHERYLAKMAPTPYSEGTLFLVDVIAAWLQLLPSTESEGWVAAKEATEQGNRVMETHLAWIDELAKENEGLNDLVQRQKVDINRLLKMVDELDFDDENKRLRATLQEINDENDRSDDRNEKISQIVNDVLSPASKGKVDGWKVCPAYAEDYRAGEEIIIDREADKLRAENERLRGLYEREREIAERVQAKNERLLAALEKVAKYPKGEALVYVSEIKKIAEEALSTTSETAKQSEMKERKRCPHGNLWPDSCSDCQRDKFWRGSPRA